MDIVYFARGEENEELRYSIRSVCKNFAFPVNKIVIVGTKPKYITPDLFIELDPKINKYANVRMAIEKVLDDDRISEDFILMNDDFFVMKRVTDIPNYFDGSLYELAGKIICKYNGFTEYSAKLLNEARFLVAHDLDVKNFEVHIPMLINKTKAKELLKRFNHIECFRSTYGNLYCQNARQLKDVKDIDNFKGKTFLSTSNHGFIKKPIGDYIRKSLKNNKRAYYEQ